MTMRVLHVGVRRHLRLGQRYRLGAASFLSDVKVRVARVHEHISNQRRAWTQKKSVEIANAYDIVGLEDIDLRGMAGALKLGKSTNDNGFGMFREQLAYKLAERGKKLIIIDKWFPSSKTCHVCGYTNDGLTLGTRQWICPACDAEHDRDYNAAINIREVGLQYA